MKLFQVLMLVIISMLLIGACDSEKTVKSEEENPADVLYINEFLASNDASNADENGDYDDWIEIYNSGSEDIDLAGMYVSDDKEDPLMYQIPTGSAAVTTTVKAGGYLIIWCDKEMDQGPLHVEIKLSSGGEDVVLTDSDGVTEIDSYTYDAAETDKSNGRTTDGGDTWGIFDTPTPGASNN